MSAFVVDRRHIDVILTTALEGPRGVAIHPGSAWSRPFRWYGPSPVLSGGTLDETNLDEVGRMLLAENCRSVSHRYRGEYPLPGPCDVPETTEPDGASSYTYTRPPVGLTVVEALNALRCYEYQACETPDFRESRAFAFCDTLRHHLIASLPGMSDAPWEWTDDTFRQRACAHRRRLISGNLDTCADCHATGLGAP